MQPESYAIGTMLGLSAAACQSISYLFSRQFTSRTDNPPMLLLIVSQLMMGVASMAILVILRPSNLPPFSLVALPLAGASLFCLAAQLGLFHVLSTVESSRVSPLLGTKVLVLAALSILFTRTPLAPGQWAAVLLCAVAAWFLNETGGRVPLRAVCILALTVIGYCLSDLNIGILMNRFPDVTPFPSVVAVAMTYVLSGIAVLPFACRRDAWRGRTWIAASPFAAAWFVAMCLLYACFGVIGVVFGNVVQATRGIMSVGIGWVIAHIGHTHLESKVSRRVFWRRIVGAILMAAAVILYRLAS